jgi:DeoR/GlpR family transcriptional regulator of sugar metabolism
VTDTTESTEVDGAAPDRAASRGRAQVPASRQQRVLQLLRAQGSVSVSDLEQEFGISAMTARRDLRVLEEEGQAHRTYGGAVLPAAAGVEDSFEQRMNEALDDKERLANAAADLVADGDTVFVDCSTSAYVALRELVARGRELTVVTNALPVMQLVADAPRVKLVALGGSFRPVVRSFVGPETVRGARALLGDKALISVKGLTSEGALSDPDPLEAEVKRVMIEQSTQSIFLLQASKLERRGLAIVANLEDLSVVFATGLDDDAADHLSRLAPNVRRV